MNFQDEELLKIFDRAIMPDSLHGQTLPIPEQATGNDFQNIALTELQTYCDGLEQKMIRMQQEINTLKHAVAQEKQTADRETNECKSLRRQMEHDRLYLLQILNSRAWGAARTLHYLRGILTFNRAILLELKTVIDDRLLKDAASQSTPKRKAAVLLSALMHQATRSVKKMAGTKTPLTLALPDSMLEPGVYGSIYQDDERFPRLEPEVRAIAFYLPQYHTFPENDEWWGKGFTEWTNTRKAKPRFPGHYQPRTPHKDIGYYDLSQVETLKRQAALAKAHGIEAFCMYYYWFDGKKLMEKPLELLVSHPEIKLKFCLCWANENWTRTWDGQEKSVLIQQNYSEENDIRFIQDLKKYITDPRYVRCNGKPVILIYHAKILPSPNKTFALWRDWCRKNGVGEIQIWSCRTFIRTDEFKKPLEVDREVEFPPHMVASLELIQPSVFKPYKEDGFYYNYAKIIEDVRNNTTMADRSPYPYYRCAMLGWDNSARRAEGYSIWQYFSLDSYHFWLRKNIEYTKKNFPENERFIFINAWNEWAEGTYLEPDERFGYASINTTTRALCDLPARGDYQILTLYRGEIESPGKILIHLHAFYPDLMEEFIRHFNNIPFEYDCEITTDTRKKSAEIKKILKAHPLRTCSKCHVTVTPNCGRDVAPFFAACSDKIAKYDFIGHFHTKKSVTVNWGDEWRHYLLDQLLGSEDNVKTIFRRFSRDARLGLCFPCPHPGMRHYMHWEKNRERCEQLLAAMGLQVQFPERPLFPVGQMFWARTKAIEPLFRNGIINQKDFESENGQISDTLAHATERIWKYVAEGTGFTSLAATLPPIPPAAKETKKVRRLALFVHYQADKTISDTDLYLLKELAKSSEIIVISNSGLSSHATRKVLAFAKDVIVRNNTGYDFCAWKAALNSTPLDNYDELVLLNNSIIGPFHSFDRIFGRMERSNADFWGMTEFPETHNPKREEAKYLPGGVIPRHIQSYFLVFRRKAIDSKAFHDFWASVKEEATLPDVVAKYETQLTRKLEEDGLISDAYLRTAARLQDVDRITPEYNAIYCRPQDFLVLGFPFLKKNICYYMSQPQINETVHMISLFSNYPTGNINITAKKR